MKKACFLLFIVFVFAIHAQAQVTIGSLDDPDPNAALELKSDNLGFLPTRIALSKLDQPDPLSAHVPGMVVYNTQNDPAENLQPGLYYNNGSQWVHLSTGADVGAVGAAQKWFYMPSIPIDVTEGQTKDLYAELKKQLHTAGGLVKPSSGAPEKVLAILPAATDLYYYVTAYDPLVFDNIEIDEYGVMKYDIIAEATDATFMNIVLVEK